MTQIQVLENHHLCPRTCSPSSWISGPTSGLAPSSYYASTATLCTTPTSSTNKPSNATSSPGRRYLTWCTAKPTSTNDLCSTTNYPSPGHIIAQMPPYMNHPPPGPPPPQHGGPPVTAPLPSPLQSQLFTPVHWRSRNSEPSIYTTRNRVLVYGLHREGHLLLHECRVRLLKPHYLDHIIQIRQDIDRITNDNSILNWWYDEETKLICIVNLFLSFDCLGRKSALLRWLYNT